MDNIEILSPKENLDKFAYLVGSGTIVKTYAKHTIEDCVNKINEIIEYINKEN